VTENPRDAFVLYMVIYKCYGARRPKI